VGLRVTSPSRALRERPRFACHTHLRHAILDAPASVVVAFDPTFTEQFSAELEPLEQTVRMPRLEETVLRRPPAPEVRELTDRAELLQELIGEMLGELRELQNGAPE
jgi:hypothetical protein